MKYIKKLFSLVISTLLVGYIYVLPASLNTKLAESEPDPGSAYQIIVNAEFSGQKVGGMSIDVSGTGYSETKTTSKDADTVFENLEAGEYTIDISIPSSSEYELSGSKSSQKATLSDTNQQETITFNLQKKAPEVDDNLEAIKSIEFPSSLTKVGSTTTDLSKLSPEELSNVESFTFDNPGVNKIVYQTGLNLENFNEYKNIVNIGNYIDLEKIGVVEFNTDDLEKFDASAKITMSQINLVDYVEDSEGNISDVVAIIAKDGEEYDEITALEYKGTDLSFVVPGFSTYTLLPRANSYLENIESEEETGPSPNYTTDEEIVNLVTQIDNLDAKVTVTNNGEIVNYPEEANDEGLLEENLNLEEGDNKVKIRVELSNGETTEQILNIEYTGVDTESNNASKTFTIAIILLLVLAAAGGGAYYYYRAKNMKGKKKGQIKIDLKDEDGEEIKEEGPDYEEKLLTDEEKEIYMGESFAEQEEKPE